MASIQRNTTNKTVIVSYPAREAQIEITEAEHDLIVRMHTDRITAIKFIRQQHSIGLYEAKQIVDTILLVNLGK